MQQGVLVVQGVCVWHMKLHVHVARNFALNGAGSRNSNKAKSRRRRIQTETAKKPEKKSEKKQLNKQNYARNGERADTLQVVERNLEVSWTDTLDY